MIVKAGTVAQPKNDYPTSDGKPMAETDLHRDLMLALIETLKWWFRDRPKVYVSGNLLVHYQKGNKRVHVSPDVFVVPGIGNHRRENYLLWEEARGLDVVIELTSKTTKREDVETKYNLYLNKLGVKEYFLFDPKEEYLKPSFQGFRRVKDEFRPIKPMAGRMPSKALELHLERVGEELRLWNPANGEQLPTPTELAVRAEAEIEQLRHELEQLRGKSGGKQ